MCIMLYWGSEDGAVTEVGVINLEEEGVYDRSVREWARIVSLGDKT